MGCQNCYHSVPTEYVELHHNVGMIVLRQQYSTCAHLCRECLHEKYRHHLLCNATLGWWGMISFFATLYFLVANTVVYLRALARLRSGGAPAQPAPVAPELEASEVERRLSAFEHNVRLRLRLGEAPEAIGQDLASLQGVPLGAAKSFVEQLRA